MTPGKIWKLMLQKKVFQIWEIAEELQKLYPFLPKKWVRDKVREFVKTQIDNGAVVQVYQDPPVFAVSKYANEWKKYASFSTCPVCSSSFLPQTPQQIYCSETCREKADYERKKDKKKEYLKTRKDLTRKASRKYKQKLQAMTPAKKRGPWTQEELELLKREYEKKGHLTRTDLVRIAQALGRSFSAVMHKYYEEVRK